MPEPGVETLALSVLSSIARQAFAEQTLRGRTRTDAYGRRPDAPQPILRCLSNALRTIERREEALSEGYGHLHSLQVAQRVAIFGSQISTEVLHNHTAEQSGYDRQPLYVSNPAGRHRHIQASPRGPDWYFWKDPPQ